jgi:hypothetical protein
MAVNPSDLQLVTPKNHRREMKALALRNSVQVF